jgi:predicted HAD superfamily phosphohydrolase YqeG
MREDFQEFPEEERIDFKFKKPGFKKLLILDLDETLIHVKRDNEDEGCEED